MSRQEELAQEYTRIRPRLTRIAYSLLGTRAEAEDVVSDCWLRLAAADQREPVADVEGWAIVAVGRRALDVLRSARIQREAYVGPWLPEPVPDTAVDPADRVTLDETISFALMVVLETLTPAERTAWVMHDVFGMPFNEIATVVGRQPAAVRQLAARARTHIQTAAPRVDVNADEHRRAVTAFYRAAGDGDLAGLVAVLDPDVVLTSDGGGRRGVARRPVYGPDRVARFLFGIAARMTGDERLVPTTVNGGPGFAVVQGSTVTVIGCLTTRGGYISRVDLILAPDKLPRTGQVEFDLIAGRSFVEFDPKAGRSFVEFDPEAVRSWARRGQQRSDD